MLRIADLRVDPQLDEICKDGHAIKLEPKAMRLLICLAERAGDQLQFRNNHGAGESAENAANRGSVRVLRNVASL